MSVLIVEDNNISAKVVDMLLKKSGYETIVARSGTEALEFLAGMPPLTAAVIDIMLPGISGLELVREMRKIDEYMDTPVVMCSARADQDTIQDCLRQGLRYYILKPINEEELLKKLRMAMAEGVPVKEVRAETVRKLGIDVKTYDDTAQGFSVLLHDTVEEIQLQFEEKGEAEIDFTNIDEGVEFFSAGRMSDVLRGFPRDGHNIVAITPEKAPTLIEEMKALQRALQPVQRTATI